MSQWISDTQWNNASHMILETHDLNASQAADDTQIVAAYELTEALF